MALSAGTRLGPYEILSSVSTVLRCYRSGRPEATPGSMIRATGDPR